MDSQLIEAFIQGLSLYDRQRLPGSRLVFDPTFRLMQNQSYEEALAEIGARISAEAPPDIKQKFYDFVIEHMPPSGSVGSANGDPSIAPDVNSAQFTDATCNYWDYLDERLEEYFAILELIKAILSDPPSLLDFTGQIIADNPLSNSIDALGHGVSAGVLDMIYRGMARQSGPTADAGRRIIARDYSYHERRFHAEAERARDQLMNLLPDLAGAYRRAKSALETCGWAHAIKVIATEATLLLLEIGIEILVTRGAGRVIVAVAKWSRNGRSIARIQTSTNQIEANWGKNSDHHGGVQRPQANRSGEATSVRESEPPAPAGATAATRRAVDLGVPCFNYPKSVVDMPDGPLKRAKMAEFDRQLAEQNAAIQNMTAQEMLDRHLDMDRSFRDTQGSRTSAIRDKTAQQAARQEYKRSLAEDNLSEAEIEQIMEHVAATHRLDIIAGGDPLDLTIGDKTINTSIGSQWNQDPDGPKNSRARYLRDAAQIMVNSGNGGRKMISNLHVCR